MKITITTLPVPKIIIILLAFFIFILLLNQDLIGFDYLLTTERYEKSSCEGIETFYTNSSFHFDFINLRDTYHICYNSTESFFNDNFKTKPPSFLRECSGSGYDCDDFAFAVICLAKLYDTNCTIYMQKEYDIIDKKTNHVGTRCFFDEWVEVS